MYVGCTRREKDKKGKIKNHAFNFGRLRIFFFLLSSRCSLTMARKSVGSVVKGKDQVQVIHCNSKSYFEPMV